MKYFSDSLNRSIIGEPVHSVNWNEALNYGLKCSNYNFVVIISEDEYLDFLNEQLVMRSHLRQYKFFIQILQNVKWLSFE